MRLRREPWGGQLRENIAPGTTVQRIIVLMNW